MRGGSAFRRAGLVAALCLAAGRAAAWELEVPVVAAEPVYTAAARSSCNEPEAGPVLAPDLADALAADLDLAACAPPRRAIVGWNVRYRFDGREYRTFSAFSLARPLRALA